MSALRPLSEQDLVALNKAVLAVVSDLALDKTLQRIVEAAATLARARYAALGVFNNESRLIEFINTGVSKEQVAQIDHSPVGLGLLRAILDERRTIRLREISRDPRSVGIPENHPPMSNFLGVPIIAAGETLGNLYLTEKLNGPEFTEEDEHLIEMLAVHAATAIRNAHLHEQAGRLAIIEERSRIGMDLHDGVIQSIYAVGLTLESARLLLPDAPEQANALIGQSIDELNGAIRDIRNFILDLRPHRFEGDLSQGLARLVREFQANAAVPVTVHAPNDILNSLSLPIARTIFMTTQEALANIARHARATKVSLDVSLNAHSVDLEIVDDGRGFDMERRSQMVGHGLANMRARAEELHGTFRLTSVVGEGTSIQVALPI